MKEQAWKVCIRVTVSRVRIPQSPPVRSPIVIGDFYFYFEVLIPVIRPYTALDKGFLIEIFKKNIPEYFAAEELSDFIAYLDTYASTYLSIIYEDRVVGGLGYEVRHSDSSGRINWIFIHPEFKGKGLGSEAVEHCIELLINNDNQVKTLIVRTSQYAFKFFERHGFKLKDIQQNYWSEGLHLYLMQREI